MADEEIINRKIKLYKAGLCIDDLFFLFSASSNVWLSKHLKIYRPDDQNFYRENRGNPAMYWRFEEIMSFIVPMKLQCVYGIMLWCCCCCQLLTLPEMKRHVVQFSIFIRLIFIFVRPIFFIVNVILHIWFWKITVF